MVVIRWRCPNCPATYTTIFTGFPQSVPRFVCRCGLSLIGTLVSEDSVTDCGDFKIRVVPAWE